ncbi:MFS transporter [Paenibacillus sp. HN-1]|uniref:MFS transporter n=1 Tax=Paenibacillus TaxID=44249 RepID=UPI001CA9C939|nr:MULTISPECIES: MFS transporter [Paenibacillus]MBY9079913.1 MFS transporter [Paenibacillus sp. CGMCC 1.18879]MBY9084554.1 MFS transporter [Paenibacillus sinensis]
MEKERLWNRHFLSICFSSFFIFTTFYILVVTLPSFVLGELKGSGQNIGLVTTVFVIAAVIVRPLTGRWLDEINRKGLIAGSLLLFAVCSVLYLLVHSYGALLALRFVHGISFGIAATSTSAVVLDLIPEKRKGEGIGYFTLFMSLAMVIGPYIGLTITEYLSYRVLFAAISVFAVLAGVFGLLAQIPAHVPRPDTLGSWNIRRYFEFKAIPVSLSGFVLAFAYGSMSTFISVYAKSIGLGNVASYFFIVFAALVLISRPFTGRLYDRKGAHILVYPGILLFMIGMLWLSQATTAPAFLATAGLVGLGYGAILPSFQTLAIQSAPMHRRALATSTYFVLFDLGFGLGSYLLGIVAAKTDYRTMYLCAGLITSLALIFYYFLHHRLQKPVKESALESLS